jgi:hypothetical protein
VCAGLCLNKKGKEVKRRRDRDGDGKKEEGKNQTPNLFYMIFSEFSFLKRKENIK